MALKLILSLIVIVSSVAQAQSDASEFAGAVWKSLYKTCDSNPDISIDAKNREIWAVTTQSVNVVRDLATDLNISTPDVCSYAIHNSVLSLNCDGLVSRMKFSVSPDEMEIEVRVPGCPAHDGKLIFGRY